MRLINRKFSEFFWGPLRFIFACTMVKYCAIALCRSRSKKRHSAIQESVHYILRKVTSRFQFLVEKVYVLNAIRLSLTQRNLRILLVRVRSTFAARNRQHRKVTRMVLILRFRKVNVSRHEELVQNMSLFEQFITRKAFKRF